MQQTLKSVGRTLAILFLVVPGASCSNSLDFASLRAEAVAALVKIEDVVVRLRTPQEEHYVSANFELQIAPSGSATKVTAARPRLREGILSAIADQSLNELAGSSGVKRVREAVQREVDRVVGVGQVDRVYVTQFVLY